MLGIGAACETSTTTETHFPSGGETLAYIERICTIPTCGFTYWTGGIHSGFGEAEHYTESSGSAFTPCPPPCTPNGEFCAFDGECCSGFCGTETNRCGSYSPILINLASDSRNFDLTSAVEGVHFDIDAGGQPERIAWTEPGSDIAFLAMDRNGNGTVDNGSELFGTATRLSDGQLAANGFDALADLDGNRDGRIDLNDGVYDSLRLWLDRNHNGLSEGSELLTLANANMTCVFTDYKENPRVDRNGNRYAFVGTALMVKHNRDHARVVFDVFLRVAR